MSAKEQFNSEKDFFELSSVNFTLSYLLLLSLPRLFVSSDMVKKIPYYDENEISLRFQAEAKWASVGASKKAGK